MTGKEDRDDDVLMHFVVPYDWKSTLRGLFWINIGLLAFFTGGLLLFIWSGILYMDQQATICTILGYIIIIAIYVVIRHVTVKYDKIKEPMKVWVKKDKFIFKKGNFELVRGYDNIGKVEVIINDKTVLMKNRYIFDKGDEIGWNYGFKRGNVGNENYKEVVEKYFIPSVKIMIEKIKEQNPNVQVIWNDTRKRYR